MFQEQDNENTINSAISIPPMEVTRTTHENEGPWRFDLELVPCGVHMDPKDDNSRDTKEPVIYKMVSPRFKMPGQWSWLPLNTTEVVVALRSMGGALGKSWSRPTPGLKCNVAGSLTRENNQSLIVGTQILRGSRLGHL